MGLQLLNLREKDVMKDRWMLFCVCVALSGVWALGAYFHHGFQATSYDILTVALLATIAFKDVT